MAIKLHHKGGTYPASPVVPATVHGKKVGSLEVADIGNRSIQSQLYDHGQATTLSTWSGSVATILAPNVPAVGKSTLTFVANSIKRDGESTDIFPQGNRYLPSFAVNQLAGSILKPDASLPATFVIESNSGTSIVVTGDLTGTAVAGTAFQIQEVASLVETGEVLMSVDRGNIKKYLTLGVVDILP